MDEKVYDEAVIWCQRIITSNDIMLYRVHEFHHSLLKASTRFHIPRESLESLFRHVHLRYFKKIHYQIPSITSSIIQFYTDHPNMTIIDVARKFHLPPSVMARVILEQVTDFSFIPTVKANPERQNDERNNLNTKTEPILIHSTSFHTSLSSFTTLNDSYMEIDNNIYDHVDDDDASKARIKDLPKGNQYSSSISNLDFSVDDNSIIPPTIPDIKKHSSSYQKKAIRNALHDPFSVLGDTSSIRPMYQGTLAKVVDASYVLQKLDPFTGLLPSIPSKDGCTNKLTLDVWEATEQDPMYGPRHDRMSAIIGVEYELALEHILRSMNIPFETERDLREKGTAKTPDILLKCPIAIQIPRRIKKFKEKEEKEGDDDDLGKTSSSLLMDTSMGRLDKIQDPSMETNLDSLEPTDSNVEWKVIQWIDSKAYFGDEHTHKTLVLHQAESYVHRFGPGLILYWLGHAPLHKLDHGSGDIFITERTFPHTCLLPGEIIVRLGYPFMDT